MTTPIKLLFAGVAVLSVMGALAFFGLSPYGKTVVKQVFGSPAGSTFGTAKFAAVAINLASPGANGTSTSIQNTDTSDRYVTDIKVGCEGVGTSQTAYTGTGLSALTLTVGTTSTAAPAAVPSNNIVGNGTLTIATTTANFTVASSTAPAPNGITQVNNIWGAGMFMTFATNATNTAKCSVGVGYIGA